MAKIQDFILTTKFLEAFMKIFGKKVISLKKNKYFCNKFHGLSIVVMLYTFLFYFSLIY